MNDESKTKTTTWIPGIFEPSPPVTLEVPPQETYYEQRRKQDREIDFWSDQLKLLLDKRGPTPYNDKVLSELTKHIQSLLRITLGPAGTPCDKCGGSGRAPSDDTNT